MTKKSLAISYDRKGQLIKEKKYALDANLWTGDNVIVANAIQLGVQNLQMNAKRVVYLGLSKIETKRPGEANLTPHGWAIDLYAKDFAHIFNITGHDVYEFMELGVDQLLKKIVEFDYIDAEKNTLVDFKFPWVSSAGYIKKQGKITLTFNDLLSPYISRMAAAVGGYTIQKIKQSGGIRTVRGWRMFDLLTTQRDTGILKITVSKLMKALEVSEKMALDYYDFKRKILEPALEDIRENAKVNISFEETKSGRRITSITFKFKDMKRETEADLDSAQQLQPENIPPEDEAEELYPDPYAALDEEEIPFGD